MGRRIIYDEPKTEFVAGFLKCIWPLSKKDGNNILYKTNMECKIKNTPNVDSKAVIRPEYLKIFAKGLKHKML